MFFKKKNKVFSDMEILSPVDGDIFPVNEVKDSVFAEQLMGQTVSIQPKHKTLTLVSPANGRLEVLYPTGHAYAIKMNHGVGLLVHIGVDTVELNGKGFKPLAKQGDIVKAGEPIVKVDFNDISKAGYETCVMVIVTENADAQVITFKENQAILALDKLLE